MPPDLDGNPEPILCCSFCGRSQHEVRKLVAGPGVFICDECIELSMAIVRDSGQSFYLRSPDEYRDLAEKSVHVAEAAGVCSDKVLVEASRIWLRLAEDAAREAAASRSNGGAAPP